MGQRTSPITWLTRPLIAIAWKIPPLRATRQQIDRHRELWDAHNQQVLSHDRKGPLWIVVCDSSGQSVGADRFDSGYVGGLRALLEARDGVEWTIINHSVSGAVTADVVDQQLARLTDTEQQLGRADLVTSLIGGNDTNRTALDVWQADATRLLDALPASAVVTTIARGWREKKVLPFNEWFEPAARAAGMIVADIAAHTGPPYKGLYSDGFHPSEAGYQQWTDALTQALDLSPE